MDRSLDDVISERQRAHSRSSRGSRQSYPRDGVRKTQRDEPRNLDRDWVHDRYDDNADHKGPSRHPELENHWAPRRDQRGPHAELYIPRLAHVELNLIKRSNPSANAKIRIENLHYELTEDDLTELFERIGPVSSCEILYDRQDRSRGVAFVTYRDIRDARQAIHDYDGANANHQPIRLTLQDNPPVVPTKSARNPFDSAIPPSRSLLERVESPVGVARRTSRRDNRSASPVEPRRRSDVTRPAPTHIDRYVPGQRSPARRGGGASGGRDNGGRRAGERRDQSHNRRRDDNGRQVVQGRPRKTAQELDAEMDDYWGSGAASDAPGNTNGNGAADDDIDMIT